MRRESEGELTNFEMFLFCVTFPFRLVLAGVVLILGYALFPMSTREVREGAARILLGSLT